MDQYLERYLAGECQPVWEELLAQGAAIRQEPLASEAWAVAQETMRRVRHNIELLIPRLQTLGYRFGEIQDISPLHIEGAMLKFFNEQEDFFSAYLVFLPPPPDTARLLDELEERVGVLPLSLRAFYLEIGGVNFIGTHPTLHAKLLGYDPLFIFPLADVLKDVVASSPDEDDEASGEDGETDLFLSTNIEGGDPSFMKVPNASIDGVFPEGYRDTTFVEYLRLCLRSGGFMDWEEMQQTKEVGEALAYLRQDLLPI